MLRFFTRLERSRNFLLLAFCGLLLIGLIAFYIPNTSIVPGANFGATAADDKNVIAKVGSQEITLREFRTQLATLGQTFGRGNTLPPTVMRQLGFDKQALDGLIANALVQDQGRELNLSGTNNEISDSIKRQFLDPNGNWVGKEEYLRRVRLNGYEPEDFENNVRRDLTARKVRSYIISAEQVSEREIEEKFKRDNTKVDVVYATIDLEKVRKSGYKPSEQEMQAYYDAHKDEFKANEPTSKVDYIFVSTDDVAKIVPVSDEELKTEYEARKQFEFRASVIRLNVPTPTDEDNVTRKINELNVKVRGGEGQKPEDFATVAKGNSQDPSAKSGGDIGWIKKEPNKPGQWQQRPYTNNLKVGDIDGPFRDGTSWFIMKITEQRQVPFAQMRPTLVASAQNTKAYKKANELAQAAYENATKVKDLRKGAEEVAKEMRVSVDSMLRTTPYFKANDPLPDLGKGSGFASNPAFEEAVAALRGKNEIGEKVSIPGGFAIPMLIDRLDKGAQLSFDQARNQVEDKVRKEREPNLAKARAEELLKQAKSAADLERLMKAEGLDVKSDTNFNNYQFPGASGGGLQVGNQARAALYSLKEGEVARSPIKVGAAYLLFAAAKRTEADLTKLAGEKQGIRDSLIAERQGLTYDAFIKAARKRYEDQGKIKIYQSELEKFFAKAEAASQQQ
ncbi:MAG: SurA N-terminal domain-containing protein [Blastocatellia bacterium]